VDRVPNKKKLSGRKDDLKQKLDQNIKNRDKNQKKGRGRISIKRGREMNQGLKGEKGRIGRKKDSLSDGGEVNGKLELDRAYRLTRKKKSWFFLDLKKGYRWKNSKRKEKKVPGNLTWEK